MIQITTGCDGRHSITQGAIQIFSATVTHVAGNTATATVTLNIETTPPIISAFHAKQNAAL
jgi:hypothetical protein